jgi:hypothetical protein
MRDTIKNILKLSLFLIILLLPLAAMFGVLFNAGWFNSLQLAARYGIGLGVIALTAAVFVFIFKTRFMDGLLKYALKKDEISFERYDDRNRKEIEPFSIDKAKYKGKAKVYSQLNRAKGMFFIIPSSAMLIYFAVLSKGINLVVIFFAVIPAVLIYNYFGRIIKISPEGILSASLFRSQFIKWERVKTIGISSYGPYSKNNVDAFIWVYVSKRELKSRHCILSGERKGLIAFKFRAKMIHHILCFYGGEIINLHNVRRWRRYVKKHGYNGENIRVRGL